MWVGSFGCECFYVGQCVLRKWAVEEGGLYGYFGEQGLSVGVQEWLEGFHRRCLDYLRRQFVLKWDIIRVKSGSSYSAGTGI